MTPRRSRGLDAAEAAAVREQFGVADEQVLRDHAISHVLGALSAAGLHDDLVFFGGTALSRTFLPTLRLSEDIDLIASAPRGVIGPAIEAAVSTGLQRSHGTVSWLPPLAATRGPASSVLVVTDTISIRVQLLSATGYPRWPVELRPLEQRFSDAPPASMVTPTAAAFAGWKAAAWHDRSAARDLYDLWGLAAAGLIDREAARLFCEHGPTAGHVQPWMFDHAPSEAEWLTALGHQGRVQVGPVDARDTVRAAWTAAVDADG
ncbi:nucleotidyl transferase AbiEii/AbiGii toxin family protein [Modestobacter roseus]|uniref:Nucleotidyltransferase AbiEii toxin of type IV toxin-antitoxin system n=1 Tax=Modestobacter roseus TaxID=1181884 RepID=A0A562IS04_9ACTN|nr:nucleotidyl transferase AbiEii/AbiGii toxin family protein [Modestobacter roseus]MQA35138.1 nucleotidyl transferase AbiEii/AbiGii toxin family protein [Modestobacter roseus]TWH73630.1 nucleotidyltransferase AbiEii toxin of type IV toxin-antitoxin system [Modestobacter roseus]